MKICFLAFAFLLQLVVAPPPPEVTFTDSSPFRDGSVVEVTGHMSMMRAPFQLGLSNGPRRVFTVYLRGHRGQMYIVPGTGGRPYSKRKGSIRPGGKFNIRIRRTSDSILIYLHNELIKSFPFKSAVTKIQMLSPFQRGQIKKTEEYKYRCMLPPTSCGITGTVLTVPSSACPANKSPKSRGKIIGGSPAKAGQYPWQVAFRKKYPREGKHPHVCGGVLIDSCWVLSAAHCFPLSSSFRSHVARVGDYYNKEGKAYRQFEDQQDIDIKNIYNHPEYGVKPSTRNDISLARLVKDRSGLCAKYGRFVKPVCLPTSGDQFPYEDRECVITGWGATVQDQAIGDYPACLQEAGVSIVSNSVCRVQYPPKDGGGERILYNMTCAQGDGTDACQGDSGGPLVCSRSNSGPYTIWGITSWGEGCGTKAGVYTKVFSFLDWVEQKMIASCRYDPWSD